MAARYWTFEEKTGVEEINLLRVSRLWTTCLVFALLGAGSTIRAQGTLQARIDGTVADATGAPLPGVTITLASPALQVPAVTALSGPQGEYQFLDLPPGTFRLAYELAGFGRLVREGIILTTGFSARVDVTLALSSVQETVTVTGASPVVDVVNTRGGSTVSQEILDALPVSRNLQDTLNLAGGVQTNGAPLTGETSLRNELQNQIPKTYGLNMRTTTSVDGIYALPHENFDFQNVIEVDVKTFGNSADQGDPSAAIRIVLKSGGNDFHGRYSDNAQNHRFQSSNIDDRLRAQGITGGDEVIYYNAISGDLGGRLVRDKVWFYAAVQDSRASRRATAFSSQPGPDNIFGTGDDVAGSLPATVSNQTVKLSYQASPRHKLVGLWSRSRLDDKVSGTADRFNPFPSTLEFAQTETKSKIDWQGAFSDRLLATALFATSGYDAMRTPNDASAPSRFNQATTFNSGAAYSTLMGTRTPRFPQSSGSVTYLPGRSLIGSHALAVGYRAQWGSFTTDFPTQPNGDYRLIYDAAAAGQPVRLVNGVPAQPVQITVISRPVHGESRQNLYGVYVTDTWRPTSRLTANLGLRWDYNKNWVVAGNRVASQFQTAGTFPQLDAGTFTGFAPRAGVAYLIGTRTAVKATYGWYNMEWPTNFGIGFSSLFDPNTVTTTTYRWNDPDGDNNYTPGEVNLDPNGPAFLSVSGANSNVVNPNLEMAHAHEATASLEREIGAGFALRGVFVYKRIVNQSQLVNAARPYSAYNLQFSRQDPGPDGALGTADDRGFVNVFDYDPAYRGSRFVSNMLTNTGRNDSYKNYEVTVSKRPTRRVLPIFASLLATKNRRWLTLISQTPNDDAFPLDRTWEIGARFGGGLAMPKGIRVSAFTQARSGIPAQRTYIFRGLPQASTVTLRLEPYGTSHGPKRYTANLRLSKDLLLSGSRKLDLDLDAFNLFNANEPWGTQGEPGIVFASGPSYGTVTQIVSPRVLRVNVTLAF